MRSLHGEGGQTYEDSIPSEAAPDETPTDQVQTATQMPRRIRRGNTLVDFAVLKREKEAGKAYEEEIPFNDSTIETLLDSSPEMLLVADLATQEILACNQLVERKTGKPYTELNNLNSIFKPDTLQNLANGARLLKNQTLTEHEAKVDLKVRPIYWCGRNIQLITIEEQKEDTISMGDYNTIMEAIQRRASDILHEAKTPLTIVTGNLSLLEYEFPAANQELTKLMIESVMRALRILNELKNPLGVKEYNNNPLNKEKIDLNKLLKRLIMEFEFWCTSRNIQVELEMPDDICEYYIDKDQISNVIQNLLHNAKDAMPDGGTIRVGINDENPEYICIFVEDEGTGIDEENLEKIFQPFFSTKKEKKSNNMGLGLAVVKRIIEKHEGEIIVQSQTGDNSFTKFMILLPKDI